MFSQWHLMESEMQVLVFWIWCTADSHCLGQANKFLFWFFHFSFFIWQRYCNLVYIWIGRKRKTTVKRKEGVSSILQVIIFGMVVFCCRLIFMLLICSTVVVGKGVFYSALLRYMFIQKCFLIDLGPGQSVSAHSSERR